ncbi:hypothetical protein MRB53_000555 [Persea americana]|uniref:Uncharacterized protein n=1 Tax=Persea americana TaxID=3435 RepID=A0ACC2MP62_PERAE|nr:hypothetical protein MRB53_000555 [Persea americana]
MILAVGYTRLARGMVERRTLSMGGPHNGPLGLEVMDLCAHGSSPTSHYGSSILDRDVVYGPENGSGRDFGRVGSDWF